MTLAEKRVWAELEAAIRACCVARRDTDAIRDALLADCRREPPANWPGHLRYFTAEAERWAAVTRPPAPADDRRRCDQCSNLAPGGRCLAAQRCDIAASRTYAPARDVPMRCEGYAPGPHDPDRRPGRKRWPGLSEKRDNGANA